MTVLRPWAAVLLLGACAPETDGPDATDPGALYEAAFVEKDDEKADGGCSGVRVPDRGGFEGRIALTFDDGPSATNTPLVLESLRAHGAPATFFVNGVRVGEDERAVLDETASDPDFLIGNHTWSHANLARLPVEDVADQIDRNAELLGDTRYFRFPYGASTCETARMVRDRGLVTVGWHVDSADWCFQAGHGTCRREAFRYVTDAFRDDMVGWIVEQATQSDGGIVLMHDVHAETVAALDEILDRLTDEGFTFVRLDDLDVFPALNAPLLPPGFIGDPCRRSEDCVFDRAVCLGATAETLGTCTRPCRSTCPDRDGHALTRCVLAPDGDGDPEGLCASTCDEGTCSDERLGCTALVSPAGVERQVCWPSDLLVP